MRSLNSIELNALIFRNQKQNKTFNKTIDLLVQITKPSIYWLSRQKRTGKILSIWPLLAVGLDVLAAASGHDAHQLAL
jgi:hypothetical protein